MKRFWFKARRFLAQKVLHTDDSPHAVAMGTAIAMVVAFLPLVGLQTVIAMGLAALARANKAVCIPIVWITNPLTMVPIYAACFGLGRFLLGSSGDSDGEAVLTELQRQQTAGLLEPEFWKGLLVNLAGMGLDLWVGCAVVGVVFATISYFLSRWGVTTYRERRRQRALRRQLFRSQHQKTKVMRRSKAV